MRSTTPVAWVLERLQTHRPFYTIRYNDGEMIAMYRTLPEGTVLSHAVNPHVLTYDWGDALRRVLEEIADCSRQNILLGCSWSTPRADALCDYFGRDVQRLGLENATWANEHWPLDAVVDGSIFALFDALRLNSRVVLVTNERLAPARACLRAEIVTIPMQNAWDARYTVYQQCSAAADAGAVFVWAAGASLKPVAWRLFREYPKSSHLDLGHIFDGVFGVYEYGWLKRQEDPWYTPYQESFVPYVQRFL